MTPYYADSLVTIYHADFRDFDGELPGDVMVTDPPYGLAHESGFESSWGGTQIQNDESVEARDLALAFWREPALVFGTWKRPRPAATRAVLIWDKGPASGMGDLSFPWRLSHEEIYVLGEGWAGRRHESVIKGFRNVTWESMGRQHPNAKPVSLMRYLVGRCPEGTILDPFMGSGTTLLAAKIEGRSAIGIEIEERYCEIAATRCRRQPGSQEVLGLSA